MSSRHLVAVGASAGGVAAMLELAAALPADFAAPVCVVLHVGSNASTLPELLGQRGRVALHPATGTQLQPGVYYVAPPDHHMVVEDGVVLLHRGPKENHSRPAIDPLFR